MIYLLLKENKNKISLLWVYDSKYDKNVMNYLS